MKWDEKKKLVRQNRIFKRNLRKIVINHDINEVCVIFPYNQKNLLVPNYKFWSKIKESMNTNSFLICSPNALVKARPKISSDRYLITANEMVLRYWEEIQSYIDATKVRSIIIVSSDLNVPRIERDFSIVFQEHKYQFNIEYKIIVVPSSFWKTIYKIREAMVF